MDPHSADIGTADAYACHTPISGERAAFTARWRAWPAASPGAPPPGLWGIIAAPPRVALAYSDDRVRGHDMGGLILTAEVHRVYWLVLSPRGRELPALP